MKPWEYILLGLGIAVAVLIGFLVGRWCPRNAPGSIPEARVDTLYIRDTMTVTEAKYIYRRVVDSIPYPVTDTVTIRDTLWVLLEREQVTWRDSLSTVYASGVMPKVDSVTHYLTERILIKEVPVVVERKSRWGIGFQAGAGATKDGVSPYVGVGVSYNFLSW